MRVKQVVKRGVVAVVFALIVGGLGWAVWHRLGDAGDESDRSRDRGPAPVAVAPVERGPIERQRTFSGTLEAPAEFVIAPKIGGRVERVLVDLADVVTRGQTVVQLDDDEVQQEVAQAQADVAVAEAQLAQARSSLEIVQRELERVTTLLERGVSSDSQMDTVRAEQLAREAERKVAEAQLARAQSELEGARIRLGYTTITASWNEGDDQRVVAERFVNEGDTVAPNTPLLSIIELDPIHAIVSVTERDYGRLQPGQSVSLSTDAFPGETFTGTVTRIAPVFRQASRQARVELTVPNPQRQLKPGMFVRARTVLDRTEDAVIVPAEAIVRRDGRDVIFRVSDDGQTATLEPVTPGIESDGRVQLLGSELTGRVVVLGQQLLSDGAAIRIPDDVPATGREAVAR